MNENIIKINIAKEFSDTPGARYMSDGEFSGEKFRDTLLCKKFQEALKNGKKIEIDLDGGYGYATSFLEESFGGLARKFGIEEVRSILNFISNDEPGLIEEIESYINESKNPK